MTQLSNNLFSFKNLGATIATISTVLAIAPSASAISLSLSPSDFTNGQGEVNVAGAANPIDQNTPSNGFGDAFSSDFLLLGASLSDTDIHTDSLNGSNSVAFSNLFSLSALELDNGINIDFTWAFQGNSVGSGSDDDNFTVELTNTGTGTAFELLGRTAPNYGTGSESVLVNSTTAPTLTAGDYSIVITLNENADLFTGHSSAAGFNQIVVSDASAAVPFEFSPGLGLLVVGGLFGGSSYLKRKKAANKIDLK